MRKISTSLFFALAITLGTNAQVMKLERLMGSIIADTMEAGELLIDGKSLGHITANTRAHIEEVDIGMHSLTLRVANGTSKDFNIWVKENESTYLKLYSFSSNPVDAPKVCLLTDATGIDDNAFNAAAWRGILDFYGDTWKNPSKKGELYEVMTAQTQDLYAPKLQQASDKKYDLIIVTGFTWSFDLDEVAKQYPTQKYMIVDVDWVPNPNVMQVTFAEHEGSFLVGVAAALKAKADGIAKPKFGFIGGIPGSVITKFEVGYVQGIKSVLPGAEVVDYYANDWGKPELAKAQARNWFDSGVYAIFSVAGGTGNGTIAQAKEYRSQGKNVWAIGVDSDQYEDGIYADGKSAVLTSMVKRVETASVFALEAIKSGAFKAEVVTFDTKSDGVGFSTKNTELGPQIVAQIEAIKAKINTGEIKIAATYKDAITLPGFPQRLQARDD